MEGQSCSLPHADSDFPEPRPTQALVGCPRPQNLISPVAGGHRVGEV